MRRSVPDYCSVGRGGVNVNGCSKVGLNAEATRPGTNSYTPDIRLLQKLDFKIMLPPRS